MRLKKIQIVFLFILFASSVSIAEPVSEIDNTTMQISDNVMSPYCPGRTLSSCPSPQAWELRKQITGWLQNGETKDGVIDRLRLMFGKEVIGAPETSGFGLLGWSMPAVFVVVLLGGVLLWLKRMQVAKSMPNTLKDTVNKKSIDLIEQELKTRMT